jgi:hypothetical protein
MARKPKIIFLARDQEFDITVNGLLPLTYHYLYFEGKRVAVGDQKPYGGKSGQQLISDANGQLRFFFKYSSQLPSTTTELTEYYNLINSLAGKKQLVVANISADPLPEDYATTAFSYAASYITIEAYKPTEEEFTAGFGGEDGV